jgi:hypothetical protein
MPTPPAAKSETSPRIVISAFADEAANSKAAVEQFAVLAALGLQYYSLRFINVSGQPGQVKNVMALDKAELKQIKTLQADYGLKVATIGSPIGKVKLIDQEDGSHNRYVPFSEHLKTEVPQAIDRALEMETTLIRGFSFYHPKGTDPKPHLEQAGDQLAAITAKCAEAGLVYGLEVEANLIGQNGVLLAALAQRVCSPNMVLIFDGGNISSQNLNAARCLEEFQAMKEWMGWMHIKDYAIDTSLAWTGVVDEERLKNFVPCDQGDSGHEAILRDLKGSLVEMEQKMKKLGAPGVFLELEPHLKGGGQFGGFSGPDGLGVACRSLCNVLDYVGIDYELRTIDHIRAARGF